MSHPNFVQSKTSSKIESFEAFGLREELLSGLAASGFNKPTEIQSRAIPVALEGHDILASAQTGTGKTAAFVLPALQHLLEQPASPGRGPRVLVLTPTRELARQVQEVIRDLGRNSKLRSGSIVGGLPYGPQRNLLRGTLDLLVATPGRLIDHIDAGLVDFSRIELFILDEADRMLDMGFIKPVQRIAAALPNDRQTLLFSATLEGAVGKIARQLSTEPVEIRLAHAKERHRSIEQRLHMAASPEHKHALLSHLLADPQLTQAIVFTATKRGADKLAKRLETQGHKCAALHGNMRQNARLRTVDLLRRGKVQVLVATDVAARGIDLEGISHVINFELPTVAEDYIHRIGRTGRNGATGIAISIVGPGDRAKLGAIERLTGAKLERMTIDGLVFAAPDTSSGSARPASAPSARRSPGRSGSGYGGSGYGGSGRSGSGYGGSARSGSGYGASGNGGPERGQRSAGAADGRPSGSASDGQRRRRPQTPRDGNTATGQGAHSPQGQHNPAHNRQRPASAGNRPVNGNRAGGNSAGGKRISGGRQAARVASR